MRQATKQPGNADARKSSQKRKRDGGDRTGTGRHDRPGGARRWRRLPPGPCAFFADICVHLRHLVLAVSRQPPAQRRGRAEARSTVQPGLAVVGPRAVCGVHHTGPSREGGVRAGTNKRVCRPGQPGTSLSERCQWPTRRFRPVRPAIADLDRIRAVVGQPDTLTGAARRRGGGCRRRAVCDMAALPMTEGRPWIAL